MSFRLQNWFVRALSDDDDWEVEEDKAEGVSIVNSSSLLSGTAGLSNITNGCLKET
jgi:hypothetical protein